VGSKRGKSAGDGQIGGLIVVELDTRKYPKKGEVIRSSAGHKEQHKRGSGPIKVNTGTKGQRDLALG